MRKILSCQLFYCVLSIIYTVCMIMIMMIYIAAMYNKYWCKMRLR